MSKMMSFFCLVFISQLSATVINIPAEQPTIQDGINVSSYGDTVLVQPGTYYENINYNGKIITVSSLFLTTQDTTYISSTIIDGNQNGTVVVTFESGETISALLCGFTIRNGLKNSTIQYGGGGIFILNSSPKLHNLIVSANYAYTGGGIYAYEASPIINNIIIINNEVPVSGHGGGLYLMNCGAMIIKNLSIIHNEAEMMGSGLFLNGCDSIIFEIHSGH